MRLDEIHINQEPLEMFQVALNESEEYLSEASRASAFWTTFTTMMYGVSPVIMIAMLVTGNFAGALLTMPLTGGLVGGVLAGWIASFFARGKQRDIYVKMSRETKEVVRILRRREREYEQESDPEARMDILRHTLAEVEGRVKTIEIYMNELEALTRGTGDDAGLFRRSYRKWLSDQIKNGTDVSRVLRDIKEKVKDLEAKKKQELTNLHGTSNPINR